MREIHLRTDAEREPAERGRQLPAENIRVVVGQRGPYFVWGEVPFKQQFIMADQLGESWYYAPGESFPLSDDIERPTLLCRCGASGSKPYCDGSHEHVEWDDALTAELDEILRDAKVYSGDTLELADNRKYCSYARFCHPAGGAWKLTMGSGESGVDRDLAIREASMCPSARLTATERDPALDNEDGRRIPYEFDFEPTMALLEDPEERCSGGLWLRGGISVFNDDGELYEVRNRVVLCRCGHSSNKPYCDGEHASVKWQDGLGNIVKDEELLPDDEVVLV